MQESRQAYAQAAQTPQLAARETHGAGAYTTNQEPSPPPIHGTEAKHLEAETSDHRSNREPLVFTLGTDLGGVPQGPSLRMEREDDIGEESITTRSTNTVTRSKAQVLVLGLVGVDALRMRETGEDAMAEKGRHRRERRSVESKPHILVRERRGVTELDFQHDAEAFSRMASIQE